MENTEQMIKLYHTLFIASTVLFFIGLLLAIIFFFMFDIRNVFLIRTGRAKQKTIEEMQARNLKTGKLSTDTPYTDSGELKKKEEKKKTGAFRTGSFRIPERRKVTIEPPKEASKQPVPQPAPSLGETVLLNDSPVEVGAEANGIRGSAGPFIDPMSTEVLNSDTAAGPVVSKNGFRFTITERTIVIHTSESI